MKFAEILARCGGDVAAAVRLCAVLRYPYMARIIRRVAWVEREVVVEDGGDGGEKVATFASDKYWRIYWSPLAVRTRYRSDARAIAYGVAHEVIGHLVGASYERLGARDLETWNVAEDLRINDDLEDAEFLATLPAWHPDIVGLPRGLLGEDYYDRITQARSRRSRDGDDAEGDGDGKGAERGKSGEGHGRGARGDGDARRRSCAGGSSVTGQPGPWEDPAPGEPGAAPGLSGAEIEIARLEFAQDVLAHATHGRGPLPASLRVWAESLIASHRAANAVRRSWRRILRRALGDVCNGRDDVTYRRPHVVRTAIRGIVAPGPVSYRPRIAIIGDTSGSMADPETGRQVAGVVDEIVRRVGHAVWIPCDAEVHGCHVVSSWRAALRCATGGGGTDLRPGIARAEQIGCDVAVVVTDGDAAWPEHRPRCRCVVVLTHGHGHWHRRRPELPEWVAAIVPIGATE